MENAKAKKNEEISKCENEVTMNPGRMNAGANFRFECENELDMCDVSKGQPSALKKITSSCHGKSFLKENVHEMQSPTLVELGPTLRTLFMQYSLCKIQIYDFLNFELPKKIERQHLFETSVK